MKMSVDSSLERMPESGGKFLKMKKITKLEFLYPKENNNYVTKLANVHKKNPVSWEFHIQQKNHSNSKGQ